MIMLMENENTQEPEHDPLQGYKDKEERDTAVVADALNLVIKHKLPKDE